MADEPLVSLPRLVGKRVERHRTDAVPATACHALVERHEQGRLVDAFAAGRVHEVGAWLHDLELVLADEVARLLDEGGQGRLTTSDWQSSSSSVSASSHPASASSSADHLGHTRSRIIDDGEDSARDSKGCAPRARGSDAGPR